MSATEARSRASIARYVEHWRRVAMDPLGPADRDVAGEAICDLYKGAGFGRPLVLFCSSPYALELTANLIDIRGRTREQRRSFHPRARRLRVAPARLEAVRQAVLELTHEQWRDVVASVRCAPLRPGFEVFLGTVDRGRGGAAREFVVRYEAARSSARDVLSRAASSEEGEYSPLGELSDACDQLARRVMPFGRLDCARLARHTYFRGVPDVAKQCELAGGPNLAAQEALAGAAGQVLFLRRVVLVADRHSAARFDQEGRLHCEDGPAILYPDGRGAYAFHGVAMQREDIEKPVTLERIDVERNLELRRILIDRYGGLDKYLADAGAEEVARDAYGVLLMRWYDRGHRSPLAVVRVLNSTPEPDGSRREYLLQVSHRCRTPREAIASTFGLTAAEYSPAVET